MYVTDRRRDVSRESKAAVNDNDNDEDHCSDGSKARWPKGER